MPQVLGKTNPAAKILTLSMTLNQLLWKINLSTRSVPITSNQILSWLVKAIQAKMKGFAAGQINAEGSGKICLINFNV